MNCITLNGIKIEGEQARNIIKAIDALDEETRKELHDKGNLDIRYNDGTTNKIYAYWR